MSDERALTPREVMERKKARLLEEAAAIENDMAELDRLAAKYNLVVSAPQKDEGKPSDQSIASLVDRYRADERSPYRKLQYRTRISYDSLIKRIIKDCGNAKLADLKKRNFQDLYEDWTAAGKIAMAHSLATMLRGLINFGAATLEDSECERLAVALHNMEFSMPKRRTERLTANQANEIRAMAHKMGRPSLALAQAFQFELKLGQREVIGEWVPITEQGSPEITHDGMKWIRGLRWEEIDQNWILRHASSTGGKDVIVDLRQKPTVMDELAKRGGARPPTGPVIVSEHNNLPYTGSEFRRQWRKVATAAGVPANVFNMDSQKRSDARKEAGNGFAEPAGDDTVSTKANYVTEGLAPTMRH
jgi:hypothetical protein